MTSNTFYNRNYFEYQKEIGEFGGRANLFKFEKHITITDKVLDFGCGGGFLLKNINCKEKTGVEINKVAREYCNNVNNINCFEKIDIIEDNAYDIIISNHCIEHVDSPVDILKQLYKKLKKGGKIIIVVPNHTNNVRFKTNDVDFHFYSFSPANIGNLLVYSGFELVSSKKLRHTWPPKYFFIEKYFTLNVFHFFAKVYSFFNNKTRQTIAIAKK